MSYYTAAEGVFLALQYNRPAQVRTAEQVMALFVQEPSIQLTEDANMHLHWPRQLAVQITRGGHLRRWVLRNGTCKEPDVARQTDELLDELRRDARQAFLESMYELLVRYFGEPPDRTQPFVDHFLQQPVGEKRLTWVPGKLWLDANSAHVEIDPVLVHAPDVDMPRRVALFEDVNRQIAALLHVRS